MIGGIIGMLSKVLDRLGLHIFAKTRPPITACCKSRRQCATFAIVSCVLVRCLTQSYAAEILESPEIGSGRVPDLIGDTTGSGLVTIDYRVELANEIN
jgi:hypothetical protein